MPIPRRLLPIWTACAAIALSLTLPAAVPAHAQGARNAPAPAFSTAREFPAEPTVDDLVSAYSGGNQRIVGGSVAPAGKWLSIVAIFAKRPDRPAFNFCGGTVISRDFVLTAAHCIAAMRKLGSGVSFFVREGTADLTRPGRDIPVAELISHEEYNPELTLNDVGLLRLSAAARAPAQKLVGQARKDEAQNRSMATVIGYGLTTEGGQGSAALRQVDVPMVAQPECQSVYGPRSITEANFCAGLKAGGQDACQGDSGGPLFVPEATAEPVQVGVVSWGKGCARPGFFGVYASVGHFESWIKQRVRDAAFVVPPDTSKPSVSTQVIANLTSGATETEKPSQLATVTIDIAEGSRVKVGSFIEIRVTSSISGSVVVFNENPDGHAYQLYPSKAFPAPGATPDLARIEAGRTLTIPSAAQRSEGYRFIIRPPTGTNRLRAVVVPDGKSAADIIRANAGGAEIRDLSVVLNTIVEATRGPEPIKVTPTDRASAERVYEIVP